MKTILKIEKVSLRFIDVAKPILSNISYEVREKDFIVILGSNGSGKSSLLKVIDGRYQKTAGDIFLKDEKIETIRPTAFSRRVKTLTQNCHESLFPTLTIFENYILVKKDKLTRKAARQFLQQYLEKFNEKLPSLLDQLVDKLSGGEKQALALALTLLDPPDILLLDEHTSALDPQASEKIMQLTYQRVKEHDITCLLTTHDLKVAAQYGNRIVALRDGSTHHFIEGDEKTRANQQTILAACY